MSDGFWVALFAGIPATLTVIVTAYLQSKQVSKLAEDAKTAATGKDSISSSKLDVIHTLVNSRLTEEIAAKEAALARLKELEAEISKRYEKP